MTWLVRCQFPCTFQSHDPNANHCSVHNCSRQFRNLVRRKASPMPSHSSMWFFHYLALWLSDILLLLRRGGRGKEYEIQVWFTLRTRVHAWNVNAFFRTYANGKRVNGPASTMTLGVSFTQATVSFIAIKSHHFAFEERRNKTVDESGWWTSARPTSTACCCECCAILAIATIFARILKR